MDDVKLQETIAQLELINHRLLQFMDMVVLDENEKKYLEETRQMIKKIIGEMMGEEIILEIQDHLKREQT